MSLDKSHGSVHWYSTESCWVSERERFLAEPFWPIVEKKSHRLVLMERCSVLARPEWTTPVLQGETSSFAVDVDTQAERRCV